LARPGLFDGYVAYGSAEKLIFAAGRLAEITVDAAGMAQLLGGRRSSEPLGRGSSCLTANEVVVAAPRLDNA